MRAELSPVVRPATVADAEAVQAIYAPVVRDTVISFEYEPPSAAEMCRRIATTTQTFPWLVAELDGEIAGYAYGARHGERAAYAWSADTSVYVSERCRRGGVGSTLYARRLDELRALGFAHAYAGITLPNDASVGLHEACGYEPIGVFPSVGFKFGRWHDVGWWHRSLNPARPQPRAAPRRWSPA